MKRAVTLITILFSVLVSCLAAKSYKTYDINGNAVKITASGSKESIKKGQTLIETDVVSLKEGASITLLDESTRRLYVYSDSKSESVSKIIKNSNKASNKLLSSIIDEIVKKLSKKRQQNIAIYGATIKDFNNVKLETQIASAIIYYAQINNTNINPLISAKSLPSTNSSGVYYSFTNKTDKDLFFNIVWVNNNGTKYAVAYSFESEGCAYPYILVPSKQTVDCPSMIFCNNTNQCVGYVIATERKINGALLEEELIQLKKKQSGKIQSSQNVFINIVR